MVRKIKLLSILALVVASIGFGMLLATSLDGARGPLARLLPGQGIRASAATAPGDAVGGPPSFADIAEKMNPAVVYIGVTEVGKRGEGRGGEEGWPFGMPDNPDFWDFFHGPFGPRGRRPQSPQDEYYRREGGGSGFIIDKDGWILTNNHVIADATRVTVKLADDREFKAEVRGKDELLDVALLKIDSKADLPVVTLGDSDALRVGEWVMAIGNPFIYEHTVTVGVVSHKGRSSGNPFQQFIQTDAAINFGNSGGPLLNGKGEVVGINTAISSVGQGIGFAIPINRVSEIMGPLKEKGRVARGFLGVQPQELSDKLIESYPGLPTKDGALVVDVEAGSPAQKAGMQVDDVVVEFGGKPVKSREDLFRIVASTTPGSAAKVKVLREEPRGSGKWVPKVLSTTLVERKAEKEGGETPGEGHPGAPRERPGKKLGVEVEELSPEMRRSMNVDEKVQGIVIVHVNANGAAADAGLSEGDVITEVSGKPVKSVDDLAGAVGKLKPGSVARLRVWHHQGGVSVVAVQVE